MKKSGIIIGALTLTAAIFTGCSSAYFASAGYASDDLYALHDRAQIAREQQAKAEAEKAEAEARRAEWEARIAEAEAAAAQNKYYEYNSNPYEEVLADTYESAYARRLRGFESPTYRMPSSYYDLRYSNAFTYVSAYDPAFYNIIVMGDQVWVEPKYITSMFGTWGTVVYADPWYYGWNYPWGPTFSIGSWGWSFGWNSWYNPWYSPWYGPWGPWYSYWYRPVWGWGPGWIGHPGGGPDHHFRPTIVHRPSFNAPAPGRSYGSAPSRGSSSSFNNRGGRYDLGVRGGSTSGRRSFGTRNQSTGSSSYNRYDGNRSSGSWSNRGGSTTFNRGGNSSFNNSSFNNNSFNSGSSGSFGGGTRGGSMGGSVGGRNAGGR